MVRPPSVRSPIVWNLKPKKVSSSPDTNARTVLKSAEVTDVSDNKLDRLFA